MKIKDKKNFDLILFAKNVGIIGTSDERVTYLDGAAVESHSVN